MPSSSSRNSFHCLLAESDDTLIIYSQMIREFSEYQLSRLYDNSAKLLYFSVAHLLSVYQRRLADYQSFAFESDHALYQDSLDFINESLFLLLEILNHLSTKEFLFSDHSFQPPAPFQSSSSSSPVQDVPSVLIYGLQMMIPLIHLPIIYSYPETIEKYLSFVLFLCNSSMKFLVAWLNGQPNETSLQHFALFMKQLLFSVTLIDSTTARMALQVTH